VDSEEDVFEGDDMVQWEGGWTLWVEARSEGETVGRALVVASHIPRGHPVQYPRLLAEDRGFGRTTFAINGERGWERTGSDLPLQGRAARPRVDV